MKAITIETDSVPLSILITDAIASVKLFQPTVTSFDSLNQTLINVRKNNVQFNSSFRQ